MRVTLSCVMFVAYVWVFAQNPEWLPINSEVTYLDGEFGFPPSNNRVVHTVVDAYSIDSIDVRVIQGGICGCSALPVEPVYRLHRRGDRVYYVDPADSTVQYDLYDYGASAGDTIRVIAELNNGPHYAVMVVDSLCHERFGDTTLLVQKLHPIGSDGYVDVIIGLFARSFVFPEIQICDPVCGFVSEYVDSVNTICFDPASCYEEELDFPYVPFEPGVTYFMGMPGMNYYGISHTLGYGTGGGVSFAPPTGFVTDPDYGPCIRTDLGGWPYRQLEVYPDTLLRFFNSWGQPIDIYLNRELGECWTAYEEGDLRFEACLDRYTAQDFDGMPDSVMCFTFDGITEELCISKSNGVIRIPALLHYPEYGNTSLPYEFGQQFEVLGHQPTWQDEISTSSLSLNWYGAMDLTPGDVIHVEEIFLDYDSGIINQDKLVYLNRRIVDGGTEWLWERERRQYYDIVDSLFTDSRDTFFQFISYLELESGPMRFLPGSAVVQAGDEGTICSGEFFNQRVAKAIPPPFLFRDDTCWFQVVVSQDFYAPNKWIQGLAGPYYENSYPPTFYSARLLRYYDKVNDEEWGEPFDFTVSAAAPRAPIDWIVYPNPSSGKFAIKSNIDQQVNMKLISSDGIVVMRRSISTNQIVDMSALPPGVYYYQVFIDQQIQSGKLILTE